MRLDHLLSKETSISTLCLFYGELAQLGEHLLCTQGVKSSILLFSTMAKAKQNTGAEFSVRCAKHDEERSGAYFMYVSIGSRSATKQMSEKASQKAP